MMCVEQDAKPFDKTMIAERLGVYSANGKLHAQVIGAIIKKLDIDSSNIVLTVFTKQGLQEQITSIKLLYYNKYVSG